MTRTASMHARVRLNLEVSDIVKNRIDHLLKVTDAESMAEVVRRAIAIYNLAVQSELAGGKMILRDATGKDRELLLGG